MNEHRLEELLRRIEHTLEALLLVGMRQEYSLRRIEHELRHRTLQSSGATVATLRD